MQNTPVDIYHLPSPNGNILCNYYTLSKPKKKKKDNG